MDENEGEKLDNDGGGTDINKNEEISSSTLSEGHKQENVISNDERKICLPKFS